MRIASLNGGFLLCLLLLFTGLSRGQSVMDLLKQFESYVELPREVAYVHLNKSVYLAGEPLGFKAYVLDKASMELSEKTTNLYLTIKDENGKTVKSDLLWVQKGTAAGAIQLDSVFSPGEYTLRAYTNYMLNFQESNHFEQSILVVDPQTKVEENKQIRSEIIAHVLPEGGQAPVGVESVFGLAFKDSQGYGLDGVTGRVLNQDKQEVTTFKVNALGLGKFILTPEANTQYQVEYTYEGQTRNLPIPNIQPIGTGIKVQEMRDEVLVRLSSSKEISEEYTLTIHNGSKITGVPVQFNKSREAILALIKKDLFPGINILTVFDSKGNPILERLYFNNYGWQNPETAFDIRPVQGKDSLDIDIALAGYTTTETSSLSIAIQPGTSISSNSQHTLTSFTHLAPHLKTPVQNAQYYFNDPTPKKWYELDLVMMIQGWSAYDWNTITNKTPEELFTFEKGISLVLTDNNDSGQKYFVYPLTNHKSAILKNDEGHNIMNLDYLFPIQDEKISISQVQTKGGFTKPGVYLQFKPSEIPEVALNNTFLLPDLWNRQASDEDLPSLDISAFNNIRQLDEVVVTESKVEERREKIRNVSAFGNVDFFEPDDPRRSQLLSTYLSTRGFVVNELNGRFEISARVPNSPNNDTPAILLDDILLTDYSNLYQFRMDVVDYIVVNKSGIGGGLRFGGGVIKIYTDPAKVLTIKSNAEAVKSSYSIPLTFTTPQEYYAPQFDSYNSASFLRYGTLLWSPEIELDSSGKASLRIPRSNVPEINIDLQGIYNGRPYSHQLTLPQTP